jgi:hypothetical protein
VETIVSRKLSRPSLKNYLSTGKVSTEESCEILDASKTDVDISCDISKINVDKNTDEKVINTDKLIELFSPEDSNIWETVFKAGAKIKKEKIDLVELRNFFRIMDRVRFTLFILESEKTKMRSIRSSVQIREPFLLFLLWDDTGVATVYASEEIISL